MARIRTIKPEFFTSEDIVALSPYARLLYIALWCEADKEGRMSWKPRTFKMRYLPADDVAIDEIAGELLESGMVKLYGDGLAYIPQFSKHQHVNPRESASILPAPDGAADATPKKVGKKTRDAVFERDEHACVRCGNTEKLEVDHIMPQSMGGPHIIENLRTLCKSCNSARPVAGKALDEDLAKDGLTVESLRVKFGIDASILDVHAQVGREGKGKEGLDAAQGAATTRGYRLPNDWVLPKPWGEWALEEFKTWTPDVVRVEADKFRDFWCAKAGREAVKLDWLMTWRNWCRNAKPVIDLKPAKANNIFAGAI